MKKESHSSFSGEIHIPLGVMFKECGNYRGYLTDGNTEEGYPGCATEKMILYCFVIKHKIMESFKTSSMKTSKFLTLPIPRISLLSPLSPKKVSN